MSELDQWKSVAKVFADKWDNSANWSAAWKEKATQMRYRWLQDQGRADSWRKLYSDEKHRAEASEQRCAELEEALNTAIDAIGSLPRDALGYANDDMGKIWFIRDELGDNLCRVLKPQD